MRNAVDVAHPLAVEAELAGQDSLELVDYGIGEHQLDAPVDRRVNDQTWRPAGNER